MYLYRAWKKHFSIGCYLPQPVEWLTDNGRYYIAKSTRQFVHVIGYRICTTLIRSPQSNWMTEAFMKTFKQDYVYLNNILDAKIVMKTLQLWIEDYNCNHPHSGLKKKSPREFLSLKLS